MSDRMIWVGIREIHTSGKYTLQGNTHIREIHTSGEYTLCRSSVFPCQGTAETLADVEELLAPLGSVRKVSPSIYALQVRGHDP